VHEIHAATLVSPEDAPMSGYFYRHKDPVIRTYWLTAEVVDRAVLVPARSTRSGQIC